MKYFKFKNITVASALVAGFFFNTHINANNLLSGVNNPTISSDLNDVTIIPGGGNVTINSGVTVSASNSNRAVGFNGNNGELTNLINNGVVTGDTYGILVYDTSIQTLTNNGTITSGFLGEYGNINTQYSGSIVTLNNVQGGDGLSSATRALTFNSDGTGQGLSPLPINYNIIVRSVNHYGQLSGSRISGVTNFSIYAGGVDGVAESTVTKGTYTAVLSGLTTSNIGATRSGIYSGFNWTLALQSGSSSVWDLIFSGASTADTQASLNTQARRLRSTFNSTMASGNFANMNTYDCNLFDKNNMCISAGGRYTNIDNPSSNHSAAVVVLGYKANSNIRIGGFLDQSINNNTPTGISISNKNPMMGAFAIWNKNADGLGYQVKIANAYQDKDVTTTRDVIGSSEAGNGKTNLNIQSYVGELSYAFNYQDSTIVRPYFALRYTNIKQDGYTEDTTASVTAPLTYAKLSDRSTTALMGVKLNHALTPRTNLTASLGVEQDINHKTDQLTASGVADLTSENFNNNIKRTRPVASAGAYYAVAKNQRLSGEVYYQQLPFQSTGSATAYFNYMIGF
jgi:hypothetical protein